FSDHSIGLLLEGYGLYFVIADLSNHNSHYGFEKMETVAIGTKIIHEQTSFLVVQNQQCIKIELEGQTFLPVLKTPFLVSELNSSLGETLLCLSVDKNLQYVYPIVTATEKELQLSFLRTVDEEPYLFNCKHCDTQVKVYHYPYTQSVVCDQCGSAYFMKYSGFELVNTHFDTRKKRRSSFVPGSVGTINEIRYTVRGFVEKKELNIYQSKWREFYLESEKQGYAILSEYDGHWIFIQEIPDQPTITDPGIYTVLHKDRLYEKYNRYRYNIVHAEGCFPYNIFNNSETECYEYIAPPFLLIYESDPDNGIRWYQGEYINGKALEKSFTPTPQLPYKKGVGAVSPTFTDGLTKGGLFLATLISFLLILIIHILIGQSKKNQEILPVTNYRFTDSVNEMTLSPMSFTLDKSSANLAFQISAPVSNSWFSINAELVNRDNGKVYNFEQGVEYYYGVSDGESWSEGSTTETYHLNKIPAGRYVLEMKAIREKQPWNALSDFDIQIVYDVDEDANLWWALGLLALWPVVCFFMIDYNKQRRWENSPFSSYTNNE
ncbi:MAG TPA: hypothetical protein DHW64_02310, partial [Chitinophagaceae bacterium]|nr:hypothetical protein [Chitinophagaceae bacterium]